jgi:hypothetical protein
LQKFFERLQSGMPVGLWQIEEVTLEFRIIEVQPDE